MNESFYKMLDEEEVRLIRLRKSAKTLVSDVDEAILLCKCYIEAEDFLENGPGGIDPD